MQLVNITQARVKSTSDGDCPACQGPFFRGEWVFAAAIDGHKVWVCDMCESRATRRFHGSRRR